MPPKNANMQKITAICEKHAAKLGYELCEAAMEKEPTGRYLRIYIDVDREGGVTLDDCEAFHRAVQPMVERYEYDFMEVCSPGVDRPIKNQRDADRCLGLEIEIRLYKPQDGQKVFNGQFTGYENGDITVLIGGAERTFLKKDVAVARCTINMDEVENVDLSDPERE